jgi:hypothetical protein
VFWELPRDRSWGSRQWQTEALTWRDRLRTEISAGTFSDVAATGAGAAAHLTFGDVCDQYLSRHVQKPTRRPRGRREMEILIAVLRKAEIPAAHGAMVQLERKSRSTPSLKPTLKPFGRGAAGNKRGPRPGSERREAKSERTAFCRACGMCSRGRLPKGMFSKHLQTRLCRRGEDGE